MTPTATLIGYTRVSTHLQSERNGDAMQRDALLAAGVAPEHIFSDVISGKTSGSGRPGFAAALSFLRRGDVFVAWRLDRLGRSMIDVITTVDGLRQQGIEIRTLSDGITTTTREGRMMLGFLSTLAEYEREMISDRVQTGVTRKKAEMEAAGKSWGRPARATLLLDDRDLQDRLDSALALMAKGRSGADAARAVGWSRSTLYRYIQARSEQGVAQT